jgi:hypothetical protein
VYCPFPIHRYNLLALFPMAVVVLVVETEGVFAFFLVPADVGLPEVCECLSMLELCAPARIVLVVLVLVVLVLSCRNDMTKMMMLILWVVLVVDEVEEQQ